MNEIKMQDVKNDEIEQIWLCANGFRRNFYALAYDDIKVYTYSFDSNTSPGLITTGIFSVELYLKFLHAVSNIIVNEDFIIGFHPKEHNLLNLFNGLSDKIKEELENLYKDKVLTNSAKTLSEYLSSIKNYYIELRYPYTWGNNFALFNFDILKDVIEIFKLCSDEQIDKYRRNEEYKKTNWFKKREGCRLVNPCCILNEKEDFLKKYKETGNKENND